MKYILFTKTKIIICLIYIFCFLTNCGKQVNIKLKQNKYQIIKVKLENEHCKMNKILFQEKLEGVFVEKKEFIKLTNNINNFNICYNNFFNKVSVNLKYYEDVIKTLGGNFE